MEITEDQLKALAQNGGLQITLMNVTADCAVGFSTLKLSPENVQASNV